MAVALFLASFLNFYAGLSGLIAVFASVIIASSMGFDKSLLRSGVLTFNALITGIGLGTFFEPGVVYFSLLMLAAVLTLIISVAMGGWFFKYGLPFLSIPFVLSFWFILLPSSLYENLGLTQRNIYWINEMYAVGGNPLLSIFQSIESWEINSLLETYLRSLSSIIFQDNLISGILLAVGLLISSRIFLSLSVLGFLTAWVFAQFSGSEAASITYYNIGANYMMVAIAIGGFFVIPSKYSYMWTVVLVLLTSVVLVFFNKLLGYIQLPVFSLPYAFVTILFVHFLRQRTSESKLVLTRLQQFSPETNLYAHLNNKERLSRFLYLPLQLPFWGEWMVTQGHDGAFTHKDEWGKALDFMIADPEGKTYQSTGHLCEQYYCYGKPITAPADGTVVDLADHVEDNEIGQVNTLQNWGNSIVIQHQAGVYTQLSHLRKNSIKVKKGDFVQQGQVVAQCGNSGRSPYPHLHFQVQASPQIGSRTIDYPISYFLKNELPQVEQYTRPQELERVTNPTQQPYLYRAFNFTPDTTMRFSYKNAKGEEVTEQWDSYTDAYNYKYLYSRETGAIAYYTCDHMMFYFTAFYGNRKSLLYHFFLAAYKILLSNAETGIVDNIPIHLLNGIGVQSSLNDFSAPFYNFVRAQYRQNILKSDQVLDSTELELATEVVISTFKKKKTNQKSKIVIDQSGIRSFEVINRKNSIHAQRI